MLDHPTLVTDSRVIPALLSVQQAAAQVGLKHLAIRRAIQRGELPAVKLCSRIRISPDDLSEWVIRNRVSQCDMESGP
jgi:excisionase family DNA binding protein